MQSHFFPRNFGNRRVVSFVDRRPSLGIHSLISSKQKYQDKPHLDISASTKERQLSPQHKSLNLRIQVSRKSGKLFEMSQNLQDNRSWRMNQKKRALYVKGLSKKTSIDFSIVPYTEAVNSRCIVTSQCRRIIRNKNLKRQRIGISTPESAPHELKIVKSKRKMKQGSIFRGWEIDHDDFNDFDK